VTPAKPRRRLKRLLFDRVDLCMYPSNPGAMVALTKSQKPVHQIAKVDEAKRRVYGYANVSMVGGTELVDADGEVIAPEDLEEAAAVFRAMEAGVNHQGGAEGTIFESVFVDAAKATAMGLDGGDGFAGWWIGVQLGPGPVWDAVQRKELRAFSVQGVGESHPVAASKTAATVVKAAETEWQVAADSDFSARAEYFKRAKGLLRRPDETAGEHRARLREEAADDMDQIRADLRRRAENGDER
jgi:hypothetical protein